MECLTFQKFRFRILEHFYTEIQRVPSHSIKELQLILFYCSQIWVFFSLWCKQGRERIQPLKFIKYFCDGPTDRFDIAHIAQIELHVESVASRNRLLLLIFFVWGREGWRRAGWTGYPPHRTWMKCNSEWSKSMEFTVMNRTIKRMTDERPKSEANRARIKIICF